MHQEYWVGWRCGWIPILLCICLWMGSLLIPVPAHGEAGKGKKNRVAPPPDAASADRSAKMPKRLLHMEEVEIYGEVEKPKTMFVIPRARLRYSRKEQSKDFTEEILSPVSNRWIEDRERWRSSLPAR